MPNYHELFGGHASALGRGGERRLRGAHVAIVGAGGIGTTVSQYLTLCGVGRLTVVDPQVLSIDNHNRAIFMRPKDIGTPKAEAVASWLDGRPYLRVEPVVARAESRAAQRTIRRADVICSASNTWQGRMAATRAAVATQVPCVSVGVADAGTRHAGQVLIWNPGNAEKACEGCFYPTPKPNEASGVVLPTMAGLLGILAAHIIVELICRPEVRRTNQPNLIVLDLDTWTLEELSIGANPECRLGRHRVK